MITHSLNIYFCGREACSPAHSFGPATRSHYLMHVILRGEGSFHVSGNTYHLKGGDAFLIRPDESTYYIASRADPWEYTWVAFGGNDAGAILKTCGLTGEKPIFNGSEMLFMQDKRDIVQRLSGSMINLQNSYNDPDGSSFLSLSYLYQVFGYMQRCNGKKKGIYSGSYLQKACDYIEQNFSYQIKIQDVARSVGIDRTYLYRLFQENYQISPQEYLIKYRTKTAENMLIHTNLSVTEIAYSCGFHDSASFCKTFKKRSGYTPLNYRKYRENQNIKSQIKD